jgi:hypothetical protein
MKLQTKAQGISINTIIVAAIALIVLIILIAVFTGRMGWWGRDITTAQQGQLCTSAIGEEKNVCALDEEQVIGNFKRCTATDKTDGCLEPGQICCKTKPT